jgi:hypothetical protein
MAKDIDDGGSASSNSAPAHSAPSRAASDSRVNPEGAVRRVSGT